VFANTNTEHKTHVIYRTQTELLPYSLVFTNSLSTFRYASHTLHMEVGRHTGVEKSQIICSHCLLYNTLSVVGCEYQAFFHCTKYSDNRETYLFSWYVRSRDLVSFYSLMSSR